MTVTHKQMQDTMITEAQILDDKALVETIQDSSEQLSEAVSFDEFKAWLKTQV